MTTLRLHTRHNSRPPDRGRGVREIPADCWKSQSVGVFPSPCPWPVALLSPVSISYDGFETKLLPEKKKI
jgi:hypothetical protein